MAYCKSMLTGRLFLGSEGVISDFLQLVISLFQKPQAISESEKLTKEGGGGYSCAVHATFYFS